MIEQAAKRQNPHALGAMRTTLQSRTERGRTTSECETIIYGPRLDSNHASADSGSGCFITREF